MPVPQRLIARINRAGDVDDPATPRPLLSLEDFFEGNDDFGSIGYNLPDPPSPQDFFSLLQQIRRRPDVADVVVEVAGHEEPEAWPYADTIWVITSASAEQVQSWLGERFGADDIFEGWTDHVSREPYEVPAGMRAIGIWHD